MFQTAIAVIRKELKAIVRDKKTFVFTILIPLLMAPLALFFSETGTKTAQESLQQNMNIAVNQDGPLFQFLQQLDQVDANVTFDYEKLLTSGEIALYLEEKFDENRPNDIDIVVHFNQASTKSQLALTLIDAYLETYRKNLLAAQLVDADISPDILEQVHITHMGQSNVSGENVGEKALLVQMILPLLLLTYCSVGVLPCAIDLISGEKEHGTLEPLMSTGANRNGLIIGKLIVVVIIGAASALMSIAGLLSYIYFSSRATLDLGLKNYVVLMLLLLIVSMMFSAISLIASLYAKTSKEAQTISFPLTILVMVPSMLSTSLNINDIPPHYWHIPLLNIVCLMKESLSGIFNGMHTAFVFEWVTLYILVFTSALFLLHHSEKMLFRR
jgi:sodium transport system permease protein